MRVAGGAALLVVIALGLLLLAPDDSGDAFHAEASAICDASAAEIDTARGAILDTESSDDAAAHFLRTAFVDLSRQRLAALRALDPPTDDADDYRRLLDEYESVLDRIEAEPETFVRRDPFADLNPQWDAFGLPACGSRSG